ncbi:hypothetical protein AMTRI_Chr09g35710 [Amborella trichopoda]
MLNDSLKLLDVCSIMRDVISRSREQYQIILSSLRRRDYTRMEGQVGAHVSARRKMNKKFKKCLSTLRRTRRLISSWLPQNHSIPNEEVVVALSRMGSATLFVCECLLLRFKTPKKSQSLLNIITN